MGIAPSRSNAVTEAPRSTAMANGPAAAPTPPPRLSVSNQALPAAPGTASPPPARQDGRPSRLATASPDSGLQNNVLQKTLRDCVTEASLQPVFAEVLAEHARRIDAASVLAPAQAEAGRAEARRDLRLQDVYTPEQIHISRDLYRQALDLALGECQLAEEILTRWQHTDTPAVPAVATVRTAGYLLMDQVLPAPLRARLVGAIRALAAASESGTGSGIQEWDALRKAIAEVAGQAHRGAGGYEGLQKVLLDRMMPALVEAIQRHFPGTDLQTAATQLPRFFSPGCWELWQSLVTWPAQSTLFTFFGARNDTEQAEQVEQMAHHFITLPELLDGDAVTAIEGAIGALDLSWRRW